MITSYPFSQGPNLPGTVDGPQVESMNISRCNPAVAQEGTLTVGGTAADGTYSASFYHPEELNNPIVVSFLRAAGETNAQIAAKLYADAVKKLALKATPSVLGAVVTVKFGNPLITYTVVTAAPGTGTLVWAQTVAAGGSTIPFGVFVKGGGDGLTAKIVSSGTTIGQVLGVVERKLTVQQNPDPTASDGVPVARDMSIIGGGPVRVLVEEDVTPADTPYIRIVASGNNTIVGILGKSADGGNCIDASSICKFETIAKKGETVRVRVWTPLKAA